LYCGQPEATPSTCARRNDLSDATPPTQCVHHIQPPHDHFLMHTWQPPYQASVSTRRSLPSSTAAPHSGSGRPMHQSPSSSSGCSTRRATSSKDLTSTPHSHAQQPASRAPNTSFLARGHLFGIRAGSRFGHAAVTSCATVLVLGALPHAASCRHGCCSTKSGCLESTNAGHVMQVTNCG